MLFKFLNNIKLLGITDKTDKSEIPYISFTNIFILLAALADVLYVPYMIIYLPETKLYLLIGTFQFIFYLSALFCSYKGHYFLSRIIFSLTALFFTIIESMVINFYCDVHLYLLIGAIFTFFVFPEKNRRCSYFISLCFCLTYIAIEMRVAYGSLLPAPSLFVMNLKPVIRSLLLFMIFFFAYYAYKIIRRYQEELTAKNLSMLTEINLARIIQQQIIPVKDPAENFYSFYKSMSLLGGDFYDFVFFRDSKKIGIFISDVSGHGVPAALITTMIKTAIFQSGSLNENPAELLMHLNNILIEQSGGNFVTAFYGIYDLNDRTMVYSNAGHNYPFIIDSSEVNELKGGKSIPLAILNNENLIKENKSYTNSEITLSKNTKLLFFTDGLVEARSIKDSKIFFEYSGMYDLFKKYNTMPCKKFVTSIYQDLVTFNGSDNFEDDICMICVDI